MVGQGRLHPLGSSGPGAGSTRSLTQLNTHSGSITSATKHPPSHSQTISRPIISKLFGWLVNSSAVSIFTELTFQYPLPASSLALTPKSNSNPHCSQLPSVVEIRDLLWRLSSSDTPKIPVASRKDKQCHLQIPPWMGRRRHDQDSCRTHLLPHRSHHRASHSRPALSSWTPPKSRQPSLRWTIRLSTMSGRWTRL